MLLSLNGVSFGALLFLVAAGLSLAFGGDYLSEFVDAPTVLVVDAATYVVSAVLVLAFVPRPDPLPPTDEDLGVRRGAIALTLDSPMDGHGRDACVSLEVESADRYYEEWRTRVPVKRPPKNEDWGGRTFDVTDPFGNTIFVVGPLV